MDLDHYFLGLALENQKFKEKCEFLYSNCPVLPEKNSSVNLGFTRKYGLHWKPIFMLKEESSSWTINPIVFKAIQNIAFQLYILLLYFEVT